MASISSAIAKAKATTKWAVGMCDNFVANMYGYSSSGYNTALDNWSDTPSSLKHPNDMDAPAGALMYWGGGDGHVAISLGNGSIVSTDISGAGTVSTVPASEISSKWGKPYLGWAYPYFQGKEATSTLGTWNGSTAVGASATDAGLLDSLNPQSIANGFLEAFLKPFEGLLNMFLWGGETIAGLALIAVGIYLLMVRHNL